MLKKRSFSLSGHRTSIALEPAFWTALQNIADQQGYGLSAVIAGVDARRAADDRLASALRVFVLETMTPPRAAGSA